MKNSSGVPRHTSKQPYPTGHRCRSFPSLKISDLAPTSIRVFTSNLFFEIFSDGKLLHRGLRLSVRYGTFCARLPGLNNPQRLRTQPQRDNGSQSLHLSRPCLPHKYRLWPPLFIASDVRETQVLRGEKQVLIWDSGGGC